MSADDFQHKVPRCRGTVAATDFWDALSWRDVPSLLLDRHMGEAPAHRPLTRVRLQYDPDNLYVLFRVEDRFVRSLVAEYQGDVCTDSCVELFFTPGTDLDEGYFNIEASCGGTLLFTHRQDRHRDVVQVTETDSRSLSIAHTLHSHIDPEIVDPVVWEVSYRVPWRMLQTYANVTPPAPGVLWRANFYKCADLSSHPHWLTWAPVDWPRPDFHRKEFFGTLAFG
jgi:hypothetical protein